MVIAISVGIVLASLLFMRRIAQVMARLAPVNVDVPERCCWCCVLSGPLFAAAEGLLPNLESRIKGKRIVGSENGTQCRVLDAGGLDAFQRFVKRVSAGGLRNCVSVTVGSNRCAQWRVPVSNLFPGV